MTEGRTDIHGRVLDHLLDGVMVVERGGAITVFNPAAARILGVSAGEVAGSTFTELFIAREGFEELSEFILDAVAGAGAGAGRRQVVALHAGDAARTLSVATSYIRAGGGRRRRDDGADRRVQRHHRAARAARDRASHGEGGGDAARGAADGLPTDRGAQRDPRGNAEEGAGGAGGGDGAGDRRLPRRRRLRLAAPRLLRRLFRALRGVACRCRGGRGVSLDRGGAAPAA